MNKTPQKRFIAGALCPKCQERDKIVFYQEDSQYIQECIACGFKETLSNMDKTKN